MLVMCSMLFILYLSAENQLISVISMYWSPNCAIKVLPPGQVVAQKQVEHLFRQRRILGLYLDEAARFGVHRRRPHHVRVVSPAPSNAESCTSCPAASPAPRKAPRRIGKICPALVRNLKQRRLRNKHLARLNQRRHKAVNHRPESASVSGTRRRLHRYR